MIEDKLTRDERIRLEALAQSVATSRMMDYSASTVIYRAKEFEKYIRGKKDTDKDSKN